MSPRQAGGGGGGGAKSGVTAILLVAVAVAMMLLLRAEPSADPFDPRSEADSGTRGLVVLLQHQGADVDIVESVPQPGTDRRVLVLQDRLNDDERRQLLQFVQAGGVVVMADPASELLGTLPRTTDVGDGELPPVRDIDAEINVPLGECDVPALADLRGVFVRQGVLFHGDPGTGAGTGGAAAVRRCFDDVTAGGSHRAFVVASAQGDGVVVQLGDNELFTNRLLRYADNGPLATALLAPTTDSRVSILMSDGKVAEAATISSEGDDTLADLVRPGVWMALAQLALAFVVFAVARAVRPGRPVREPEQVPIAGSELVVATGALMHRAEHASRAGGLLRYNAHRELCRQFHLPVNTPVPALDATIAARTGIAPGSVSSVLQREVADADQLLHLSNDLHTIRRQTATEPTGQADQPGHHEGAHQ